ncbi:hypothetical protein [Estrella lausannensis]|uniref:Secreted protein n=1 Tax=Estrella lausannensis TaxID=483423 RepID=A0A0H5DP58_9BACT|nr:hypothetical protein [Estrella lausannensis]CRX38281.1 conserved hypothetical protein [Estrella lausannensis]
MNLFRPLLLATLLFTSAFASEPTYYFKVEKHLEKHDRSRGQRCLREFLARGGSFHSYPFDISSFTIKEGDAVYPICSGGWCRSQTLHALLKPHSDSLVLFPPHAARLGWDPYNGQINRYRNYEGEKKHDEYALCFKREKELRMGFENDADWKAVEAAPTKEGLASIRAYYNEHYFGPGSSFKGKKGKRRVYITFASNAHVVLFRLLETNHSLKDVHIVALDLEDLVSSPLKEWNTTPRSKKAYQAFYDSLSKIIKVGTDGTSPQK